MDFSTQEFFFIDEFDRFSTNVSIVLCRSLFGGGAAHPALPPALLGRLARVQLEQAHGVQAPDLEPVVLADARGIEPIGGVIDVFEGPIDREQDAVAADLQNGVDQGLGAEIPRGGEKEVGMRCNCRPATCCKAGPPPYGRR